MKAPNKIIEQLDSGFSALGFKRSSSGPFMIYQSIDRSGYGIAVLEVTINSRKIVPKKSINVYLTTWAPVRNVPLPDGAERRMALLQALDNYGGKYILETKSGILSPDKISQFLSIGLERMRADEKEHPEDYWRDLWFFVGKPSVGVESYFNDRGDFEVRPMEHEAKEASIELTDNITVPVFEYVGDFDGKYFDKQIEWRDNMLGVLRGFL